MGWKYPGTVWSTASAWYDYVRATDSVSVHYNSNNLPTLFIGMGLDINVPPSELQRFRSDITINADFWSIPNLIHYMTPNDDPHVSIALSDTIVYWLRRKSQSTNLDLLDNNSALITCSPNPFTNSFSISIDKSYSLPFNVQVYNTYGQCVINEHTSNTAAGGNKNYDMSMYSSGIYFVNILAGGKLINKKIIKR